MKKKLEIQYAAKWAFVVATVLLAVVFIVAIARADYPNGFDKIHAICAVSPELQKGINGVEIPLADQSRDNKGGTLTLFAGEGDKGIGVGASIQDSEGTYLVYVGIFHMSDESTVVVNLLTGEEDTVGDETVQKFIKWWLGMYEGTKV